jgi:CRP-like cAMP-binding protein
MSAHLTALAIQDSPFARKLSAFVRLAPDDLSVISDLYRRRRKFADMIYQGETGHSAYILASGWACSYKILPGGARQIVDFQIPGDFLGLRSVLFRTADHNVEPITPCRRLAGPARGSADAFSATPRLATAVLWAASRDEAMVVEHLVDLGAQVPLNAWRISCWSWVRACGWSAWDRKGGYACPLSQYLLADALGLSAVHVNRVLRELREEGLLTFKRGWSL